MIFDAFKNLITPSKDRSRVCILVVDDNEVDMRVASAAVVRGGYGVLKAYDGASALALAFEKLPDLIILDYSLPDTTGPAICKKLKADERTRHIPVLFLTSMDSPGSIVTCYEEGGENYLAKPVKTAFLLKQIEQILSERKS